MSDKVFRSGFVSLIGRPNCGKSTLLNQFAGMRLAITSPKAQTTRHVVRAIVDRDDSQIIFLDTPGLHTPKNRLGNYMMSAASSAIADGDIILLMIDAAAAIKSGYGDKVPGIEREILQRISRQDKPVILLLNKVDQVVKEQLLPVMAAYTALYPFTALIPISAKTADGLTVVLEEIMKRLPEGPRYYPADSVTDQTERMIASELIREQILFLTSEEIPHGTAVEIESFEELTDGVAATADDRSFVRIRATIYCDKESHKGILIGRNGATLKKIGSSARIKIEEMIGCPSYLELFVKVREDWRNRQSILQNLGFKIQG